LAGSEFHDGSLQNLEAWLGAVGVLRGIV
jgi:hypothetical protein